MKKVIALLSVILFCSMAGKAQNYALIDMEYILTNIPAYESTNQQLAQLSEQWQNEVELLLDEAQNMYKAYQSELAFLSPEVRSQREEAIVLKEQEAQEVRRQYFGSDGELFKRRENALRPIQDQIYNAVKQIAEAKGYQMVVDRASAMSIIFASPSIDISNDVLATLGYSK
ncbi:MAG: OmpH family outer membrane protein [Tannerellaceae bacterium]|nr:OmpH family outer membrane protein [Tannerellaceae bacterium]